MIAKLKIAIFVVSLIPAGWILWTLFLGDPGPNPAETANRFLGDWALRFLLIALAVTPLRRITGRPEVTRFRRMLGLFAFFYAALHVTSYVVLDQFFDWAAIWADIVKRTYITVGMGALLILCVLAATSTRKAVMRLKYPRWKKLHRLVYVAGVLSVVHYYMMIKAGYTEPLIYGGILALLFVLRLKVDTTRLFQRSRAA